MKLRRTKPNPRVRFSWDHKDPDYELLQLRLDLTDSSCLHWAMRVEADMFAASFDRPWPSAWGAKIGETERVMIFEEFLAPDRASYSRASAELEAFLERTYGMDVLTAALCTQDLLTLHRRLEDCLAHPHRAQLYMATQTGTRLPKRWNRSYRGDLAQLRAGFIEWLDDLPAFEAQEALR